MHHGKRLYFGRDMINDVPEIYKGLLIEQDERSAHRYVVSYSELTDKVLLDIGATLVALYIHFQKKILFRFIKKVIIQCYAIIIIYITYIFTNNRHFLFPRTKSCI